MMLLVLLAAFLACVEATGKPKEVPSYCHKKYTYNKKPELIDRTNKHGLWPGLVNPVDLESGESLFGMDIAFEKIYENQNPPDCSKAKYLISEGWFQGFGSEIHGHGVALAIAVDSGRVFLQEGGWTWRYKNSHCNSQNKKSLECYFLPFSKCTLKDAMNAMINDPNHQTEYKKLVAESTTTWNDADDNKLADAVIKYGNKGQWAKIAKEVPQKTDVQCLNRWRTVVKDKVKNGRQKTPRIKEVTETDIRTIADFITNHGIVPIIRVVESKTENGSAVMNIKHKDTISDQVIIAGNEILMTHQKLVPKVFEDVMKCSSLYPGFEYFWWRAISATFILRPNDETLALIEQHRDPLLRDQHGHCISTYIRHGDKGIEMKLMPFHSYAQTALKMFTSTDPKYLPDSPNGVNNDLKVFYIATEDPGVIGESERWGSKNGVITRMSNMSRAILADHRSVIKQHDLERATPRNHEFEYLSYLLHLREIISCSAIVCTIPSNTCRLMDELRQTIGGKANRYFADISEETCQKTPCIYNWGMANHVGPVYDPKTRIWRN